MLAYETRGQGARAAIMTLNRGEGGQNVMSDDFEDALGLVRTEELLAADRYSGVEQFWGSEVDFGFSKTREEALAQWGHDRVLADVVRVVRMTRPLVLTSVFVGGPSDGHGHHAVAGQMAQEAFDAAGDPNMFPEQIRAGLRPWSPLKMYARMPVVAVSDKGLVRFGDGNGICRCASTISLRRSGTTARPRRRCKFQEGRIRSGAGRDVFANRARGTGAAEIAERRRARCLSRDRSRRRFTATLRGCAVRRRRTRSSRSLTAWMFRSRESRNWRTGRTTDF